ncbi:MAG: hypothetical protein VB858_01260 [Planctomycetaceae bacterium]
MHACLMTLAFLAGDGLSENRFEQLHAELQPAADAPWRTIPWKISLLEAQATAARDGRPIFIWAMDGHPLGCT